MQAVTRKKKTFNDRYETLLTQIDALRTDLQGLKEQRQTRKQQTAELRTDIKSEESILKDLQKTKQKYEGTKEMIFLRCT